jgi:hypothetical protein
VFANPFADFSDRRRRNRTAILKALHQRAILHGALAQRCGSDADHMSGLLYLAKQYGFIFHNATNVRAFCAIVKCLRAKLLVIFRDL